MDSDIAFPSPLNSEVVWYFKVGQLWAIRAKSSKNEIVKSYLGVFDDTAAEEPVSCQRGMLVSPIFIEFIFSRAFLAMHANGYTDELLIGG